MNSIKNGIREYHTLLDRLEVVKNNNLTEFDIIEKDNNISTKSSFKN